MTIRSCLRQFALGLIVVAIVQGARAQTRLTIMIDPSGESGLVYLSPVDAAAEYNFAKMFEVPMHQNWQPYALLLTNSSGRAIVAATIRWTGTVAGQSGAYVHDSSTDSFKFLSWVGGSNVSNPMPGQAGPLNRHGSSYSSAEGSVVLADGGRMLVAPGLFVKEDVNRQRRSPGAASGIPGRMKDADLVSARLDVVVLEDGLVLGPDESRTIDELRANKATVDSLLRAVMAAEQKGQGGLEVLRRMANTRLSNQTDPETVRQARIANTLMLSREWREELERRAAVRLPNFHRW